MLKFLLIICILSLFILGCQNVKTEGEIPLKKPETQPAFIVQPGDVLKIVVWQKNDLTQEVTVRPDGKIRLLLIGEMTAKGKTLAQIQQEVSQNLKKYLQQPIVEIFLINPNWGIYIFGETPRTGTITPRQNITLLEALILSGGFTPFADKSKIVVIRRVPGKEIRYRFDLNTYLSGEDVEQNIFLQPGDMIFVPTVPF